MIARRELISNLVKRNLKIRYKSSALGFLWSLLTPLSSILIYAVFAKVLKFGGVGYLPYLVTGVTIWHFTAGTMGDSLNAISGNSHLVKKVMFPRFILPLSTSLANAISFVLTIIVLFIYLFCSGGYNFNAAWLCIIALIMQTMLCIGIACIFATINVFFKDMTHISGIVSQAWFFSTPVMYPFQYQIDILAAKGLPIWLMYLNPMTGILAIYRKGLLANPTMACSVPPSEIYSFNNVLISFAVTIVIFFAGLAILKRGSKSFGDVL